MGAVRWSYETTTQEEEEKGRVVGRTRRYLGAPPLPTMAAFGGESFGRLDGAEAALRQYRREQG